ncbi:AbrB family transcriptional regulator [Rhodovulum sulfidophilum]|uniref:AbrB family transcriptional regulator n=3 Tax=Paracoccaceae TaxID=31989 RepID=UPI001924D940|nr:AbrB family transcriptional regulator [Rhodovulum sulfidophilum]MBL3575900.1 AbrB family transcriptional regulator [Rhodovulum sulfidophilum]MCE8432812.1 AbrB family transcriptional regulator [Rhodovulum sulfidophilum]MCF4118238.1 AbrB family transcriptional regulator [Rhodovulum sulfidophilum]
MTSTDPPLGPALLTLAIGAAGAALAAFLHMPAPFIIGPALSVTIAALAGLRAVLPRGFRDTCFVVMGVNLGASVTPEAIDTAIRWPLSLVVLTISVLTIIGLGARLLRRLFGFDPMSALLTATPGHLSFVLSLSTDLRADLPRVTMIQTVRVLALILLVPFLAPLLGHGDLPALPPQTAPAMSLLVLVPLLALAGALGLLLDRLRVPAGLLLGGMGLSALGHATGTVSGAVPAWLSVPAFIAMGTLIGTRFSGVTPRMLLQSLGAASLLTGFAALVSLVAAALVAKLLGLPMLSALIAFAPGGLETMMAMSLLLNADPAYVTTHHVFRLLMLTVALPLLLARTRARLAREAAAAPPPPG